MVEHIESVFKKKKEIKRRRRQIKYTGRGKKKGKEKRAG